ncbi:hypothetical protein GCM10022223_59040 [Kineosporia mesophila]|uniref:Uncharacterized protein n=1 Tax=Kineosporia mesophila TaxID=566012 RepID=A0ABP7AIZ1_9ACTN
MQAAPGQRRPTDPNALNCGNLVLPRWRQPANAIRDEEAAGSNPVTPTAKLPVSRTSTDRRLWFVALARPGVRHLGDPSDLSRTDFTDPGSPRPGDWAPTKPILRHDVLTLSAVCLI